MSYTTEKRPGEPIVVATLYADYNHAQEGEAAINEAVAMLDAQSEPVYYIFDVTRYVPTFEDLVSSVNWGGRGNLPTFRHPNVRESIVVSGSGMVKLAAQGLKTATWGNTTVHVVDTLDEALAYFRR
jgi:hypothetical protein